MLPKINIVGRLTREPEIKYLQSGTCVATFGIASSEKQNGKDVTCFIDCVVFGGLAEKVVQPYLKKGSQVYINGTLRLEQWTDQTGAKRSKHSVTVDTLQMLDTRQDGNNTIQPMQDRQAPKVTVEDEPYNEFPDIDIDQSEIPF